MVAAVSAMPIYKVSSQGGALQSPKRTPLLPSESDNGVVGTRRPKSREVISRYFSSTPSTSTTTTSNSTSSSSNSCSSRRSPSPLVSRTVPMTPMPASSAAIKRSQSVERRRPATPRPNKPGNAGEMSAAAKLLVNSSRSLSVSFQGQSFSLPISKTKPAPVPATSSSRKATPERRKATPVRNQTENSKPNDQHRWPGRSREVNFLTRSLDCTVEKKKLGGSESVVRALQQSMIIESTKTSFNGRLKVQPTNAVLDKSLEASDLVALDTESVSSGSTGGVQECGNISQVREGTRGIIVPARFWQETTNRLRRLPEPGSPVSKNNGLKTIAQSKLSAMKKSFIDSPISSPLRGAVRPASPSKVVTSSASSPSRGMQSPSRVRNGVGSMLNNNNNLSNTPSILSFAADVRRGKVGENRILDAHLLRLLYNRHLQWRFMNARADAAMLVQKVTAEKSLYNAWVTTSKLRHSVKSKRVELQVLRKNLKLYSILKGQMLHLDDWDLIDRDHSISLSGAIEALESSTLRLPVVGGARADIQSVKDAISSAVDVMQVMASSICALLTKVDQVNSLASQLANITAKERGLLDQCKDLLSTLTALQAKDCSLRTHILQQRHTSSSLTTESIKS
ncbi:QWRF motif-containing protein 2 [Camellia lanceoleosa]|uniref:QWRF motif-containing protein 2 n=1 Tax=Camellia lanceoleosa TaxID=1840588 RepID=A0ACC0HNK1_9ERIC|nr:QWRF motif-containing protein 2 [Camellia lanceoleosa]